MWVWTTTLNLTKLSTRIGHCYEHKWKQLHAQDKIFISTNHSDTDHITDRLNITEYYYNRFIRDKSY